MHFGATLRLLRLESGLSLRDLARRLDVSGAYLSRVENGLDSAPTPARLDAIARELDIPPTLLLGLAQRVSPLVDDYVQQVPAAGGLFLEIAHRRLSERQLSEIRDFVERRFPAATTARDQPTTIVDLLSPDRIVLGLMCSSMVDAVDVAASRLALPIGLSVPAISAPLMAREREVSSAIGGGVAVPRAYVEGIDPIAALVTLADPLPYDTPDGQPLRVVLLLAGPRHSPDRCARLARLASMTARGLAERLMGARTPKDARFCLAALEKK